MEMTAHRRSCQLYAQRSPAHMINAALMALLSARQSWALIGDQMADVKEHGLQSKYLFGYKRTGYRHLLKYADSLYADTMMYMRDEIELMDVWSTVPGLGLAKAGFVVQLVTGRVGCIDSHNAKLYDVPVAQLRLANTLTARGRLIKLEQYIDLCEQLGGSSYLWDEWCTLMAGKYPTKFKTPAHVSRAHLQYLKRGPL